MKRKRPAGMSHTAAKREVQALTLAFNQQVQQYVGTPGAQQDPAQWHALEQAFRENIARRCQLYKPFARDIQNVEVQLLAHEYRANRAILYALNGQLNEAINILDSIEGRSGEHLFSAYLLALFLFLSDDVERADALCDQLIKSYHETNRIFQSGVAEHQPVNWLFLSNHDPSLEVSFIVNLMQTHSVISEVYLLRASCLEASEVDTADALRQGLYWRGRICLAHNALEAAAHNFELALAHGPNDARLHFHFGLTQFALRRDLPEVHRHLELALQRNNTLWRMEVLTRHAEIAHILGEDGRERHLLESAKDLVNARSPLTMFAPLLRFYEMRVRSGVECDAPYWRAIMQHCDQFRLIFAKAEIHEREDGCEQLRHVLALMARFANYCVRQGEVEQAVEIFVKQEQYIRILLTRLERDRQEAQHNVGEWPTAEAFTAMLLGPRQRGAGDGCPECTSRLQREYFHLYLMQYHTLTSLLRDKSEAVRRAFSEIVSGFAEGHRLIQALNIEDEFTQLLVVMNDQQQQQPERTTLDMMQSHCELMAHYGESIQEVLQNAELRARQMLPNNASPLKYVVCGMMRLQQDAGSHCLSYYQLRINYLFFARDRVNELRDAQQAWGDVLQHGVTFLVDTLAEQRVLQDYLVQQLRLRPNAPMMLQFKKRTGYLYCAALDLALLRLEYVVAMQQFERLDQCGREMQQYLMQLQQLNADGVGSGNYADRVSNSLRRITALKVSAQVNRKMQQLVKTDPLVLFYGKQSIDKPRMPSHLPFPYEFLQAVMRDVVASYPQVKRPNISVHALTFLIQRVGALQPEVKTIPFCSGISIAEDDIQMITFDELQKPKMIQDHRRDWQWAQDAFLTRVQSGWDVVQQNAENSGFAYIDVGARPAEFEGQYHKHSEPVHLALLEQMDPAQLVAPLQLQRGDKVMAVSQDSIGKKTSCYSCRLAFLSAQALSVDGSFAQRLQQYLVSDAVGVRVSGTKHERPMLKVATRVFASKFHTDRHPDRPEHRNYQSPPEDARNVKRIDNAGVFQAYHADAYGSGRRDNLAKTY